METFTTKSVSKTTVYRCTHTYDIHKYLRELVGGKAVLNQISIIFKTQAGLHHSLVDFDNHLDDISLDWLNHEVNEQIEGSAQLALTVGDKFGSSPIKETVAVEDVVTNELEDDVDDNLVNEENLPEQ